MAFYNPGNYPGSKFSVSALGGRSGLPAARAASAYYRRPVNRRLFARRGRGSTAPRMPFSMRGRYRKVSGNRRRVRQSRNIRPELKNWDQAFTIGASATLVFPTGAGVAAGAAGAPIIGLAQGFTQNTRIGRKIVLKTVQVRGNVNFNPAAGAVGSDYADLYLVRDNQCNKALPLPADMWQDATVTKPLRNLDYGNRFSIVKHERFTFEAAAGVSGAYDPVNRPLEWFVKCNDIIELNAAAGAFGEFNTVNYYLMMGSASGLVSINAGNTRIRFTDA